MRLGHARRRIVLQQYINAVKKAVSVSVFETVDYNLIIVRVLLCVKFLQELFCTFACRNFANLWIRFLCTGNYHYQTFEFNEFTNVQLSIA